MKMTLLDLNLARNLRALQEFSSTSADLLIIALVFLILVGFCIIAAVFLLFFERRSNDDVSELTPQGKNSDYSEANKMARQDDWKNKKRNGIKDEKRRQRHVKEQLARLNQRRRSAGRLMKEAAVAVTKELVPEGSDMSIHDGLEEQDRYFEQRYGQLFQHKREEEWSRWTSLRTGCGSQMDDMMNSIFDKFTNSEDMPIDTIVASCIKLFGFLGPLCSCTNRAEITKVLIAAMSQHVSPEHIGAARALLESNLRSSTDEDQPIPEGLDLEKVLTGFRDSAVQVRFLPMTKAIVSTMMLMVVSGMKPSEGISNAKMATVVEVWEKKVVDTLSFKNMADCVAEIFDFSLHVIRAIKNGDSLRKLIMPNTLHKQYAALMPMRDVMYDHALEDTYNVSVEGFHSTAIELLENMNYALSRSKSPQERTIFTRYILDLSRLKKDIEDYLKNHSFREEPYVVSLSGGSSLGKSQLVQIIIAAYANLCGEQIDESQIAYVKGIAKYDDNVTNATKVVVADDVCNITPSETERGQSFLAKCIEIANNTPSMTNQAELSMKGRHYWRPKLVIITTNVENLMAPEISNKPYSLVRRMRHVEITVMRKYLDPVSCGLDVSKVQHVNASTGEVLAPMHMAQWFHFVESGHNKQIQRVNEGDPIPFPQMLTQMMEEIKVKRSRQKKYIDALRRMRECDYCKICYCPRASGWCTHIVEDNVTPEAGEFVSHLLTQGTHQFLYWITNVVHALHIPSWFPVLEGFMGVSLLSICAVLFARNQFNFGPTEMKALGYSTIYVLFSTFVFYWSFQFSFEFGLFFWPVYVVLSLVLAALGISRIVFRHVTEDLRARMRPNIDVNPVLRGAKIIGTVICVMKMAMMVRDVLYVKKPIAQGNLAPASMDEVEERNAEVSEWARPNMQIATPVGKCMTMTREQALARIASVVWRFALASNGLNSEGTVTFVSTNLMIIAEHTFRKMLDKMDLDSTPFSFLKNRDQLGQQFSSHLVNYTHIESDGKKSDHVMVKLAMGPTMPNIIDFFPTHKNHKSAFSMIFRDADGNLSYPTGKYNNTTITVKGLCGTWRGSRHSLSSPSEAGNCSSPAVSWDKPHQIIGLHSAGSMDGKTQVTFCLTREEVQAAVDRLKCSSTDLRAEGVDTYPLGLQSEPDLAPFGEVKARLLPDAHERACVNWCPENGCTLTTFFGEVPNSRISPSSMISDSLLKPVLKDLGVSVDYGSPKFNSNRTHSKYLNIRRTSMKSIPPSLVSMAVRDYMEPILDKLTEIGYKGGRFLSLDETVNGIEGSRFIGNINEKTSSGFGLKGKKDRYLEIDYDLNNNGRKIFTPKPEIVDRFEKMMDTYAQGETCGMILRSALKDEAVKYDPDTGLPAKEDRLFMSCGMVDVFTQKSMTAKVAECIQSFPLLTETAVGINSTTDEWDQIYEGCLAPSPEMVLAGDYSKYDVRLSGQIIRAAAYVILAIAKHIGYSQSELKAMEILLFEQSNNYRIFGGCMIAPDGYMPSGIYLTLLLNCIANAIIHRCAYYSAKNFYGRFIFPRWKRGGVGFRDNVKMIFMGDDSLGCSMTTSFSMLTMKGFCDEYQMAYTTGDKKTEIIPFINAEDAEFCKRKFYLHPKLGKRVGNLDVRSLIKSLCTYTKSITDERTVLSETIDANLRELARHPKEVFDEYRKIFDDAATKVGIRHMIKYIDRSYDEWWEILTKVYRGEKVSPEEEWQPMFWSLDTLLDE